MKPLVRPNAARRRVACELAVFFTYLLLKANEPMDARAWLQAGHGGDVTAVAVAPDGRWIASASDDATVKLWRAEDGSLARTFAAGTFQSTALAFYGTNTLAVGYYDGSIRLWSLSHAAITRSMNVRWTNTTIYVSYTNLSGKVNALAFTTSGQQLVSGGGDWFTRVWNTANGQQVSAAVRHRGGVLCAAASPDGSRVALGSEGASIVILRTTDWSPVKTNYHASNVLALAYSPNGATLASAGLDQTIRFWRSSDWALQQTVTNETSSVLSLAFSPDGQTLYCGDQTGTVKARQSSASWAVARSWMAHSDAILCLAMSPDGSYLVTGGADHQVRTWQPTDGALLRTLTGHSGRIARIIHSPDGARIATASDDGTVRLWDTATGDPLIALEGHTNQVSTMAFAPDATVLATGGGCLDNTIRVWRCSDGVLLRTIPAHTNGVNALAISPDGLSIASAGDRDEPVIRMWNLQDGSLTNEYAGDTNGTSFLAYSRDGAWLAAGAQFKLGQIRLWNLNGGPLSVIGSHAGGVQSIAFSPDGSLVASAGRTDRLVKVWRPNGTLAALLTDLSLGARAVVFSPNGSLLAAAGSDRLQFWRTSDWEPVWNYTNEMAGVSSFAFSPNGTFFVFGRDDGTFGRLWNPQATPITLTLALTLAGESGDKLLTIQNPDYSPILAVQAAPEFGAWLPLTNLVAGSNLVEVTDSTTSNAPIRFYRVSTPE